MCLQDLPADFFIKHHICQSIKDVFKFTAVLLVYRDHKDDIDLVLTPFDWLWIDQQRDESPLVVVTQGVGDDEVQIGTWCDLLVFIDAFFEVFLR